jgi:hypothetical protein
MSTWILLDRTEDLLPALFRQMNNPDFVELFDSTELAIYADMGPLLVKDDGDGTLLHVTQAAPATWPGLVIESEHSAQALLDHLRHIIIIGFEQSRKGMLRYWSPTVAQHFFPACTTENLNFWLGPISRLSWHSSGENQWQSVDNPRANLWQTPSSNQRLTLSTEQEQALELYIRSRKES